MRIKQEKVYKVHHAVSSTEQIQSVLALITINVITNIVINPRGSKQSMGGF